VFAVVKTGGKQYKVRVGQTIDVEKLAVDQGAQVRLDQVLLASNDGAVSFGRPLIDGALVTARVVRQHKGPKLIVFKYKSKSRYRRRTGHRQNLTQLLVQAIDIPGLGRDEETRATIALPASAEAAAPPVATDTAARPTDAPVARGSAAPVDDVLTVGGAAGQVDATDANATAPIVPAAQPAAGLPGQEPPTQASPEGGDLVP